MIAKHQTNKSGCTFIIAQPPQNVKRGFIYDKIRSNEALG